MYKIVLSIVALGFIFFLTAMQKEGPEVVQQEAQKSIYQSSFECEQQATTGSFQNCNFTLSHEGKDVKNTEIFLEGGMAGHHHGLPTTPEVIWYEENNSYSIKGLKFSMPGKWTLNFKINAEDEAFQDIIVVPITVK